MSERVAVRVRDCACPGQPHPDGDEVYVSPTLSLEGGLVAEHDNALALQEAVEASGLAPGSWTEAQRLAIAQEAGERLRRRWLVTFVRYGAVGWNLLDETGPLPFSVDAILADYGVAVIVAEKCNDLFGETVARPLLGRQRAPSGTGRTGSSTSPTTPTRKRSRRSSPVTLVDTKRSAA